MYSFSELCSVPDYPFCYLLGVLKKWPSKSMLTADNFTDPFGWLMNVEDQSATAWQTRRRCELTKRYVLPTAPLTMTPSWSPFPLAFDVLPKVLHHGRSQGNYSKAFAIFEPERRIVSIEEVPFGKQVFRCEIPAADHNQPLEHIHAQHFLWLLNLTVARAVLMKKPVLLAGLPGFSYQNELERDLHGEGKLRLLKAGYLYPDRVPQGARFEYLTNDEARRVRAEKLSAMKEEAQNLPPPPSV